MMCLHGKQAFALVTNKSGYYVCDQNPSCHFECREADGFLFEKAIQAFFTTNKDRPKCCVDKTSGERNYAKIRVVKDIMKPNFGRPFFVCSKKDERCNYFEWGDEAIIPKPLCEHGKPSQLRTVKKEGPNKGRTFLCCPEQIYESCNFFQWIGEEEQLQEEEQQQQQQHEEEPKEKTKFFGIKTENKVSADTTHDWEFTQKKRCTIENCPGAWRCKQIQQATPKQTREYLKSPFFNSMSEHDKEHLIYYTHEPYDFIVID